MNRDEKRMMRRIVQGYDRSIRNAHDDLEREISKLQYREESKLQALPASFENSPTADNLTEASDMLKRILTDDEKIMIFLMIFYMSQTSALTTSLLHARRRSIWRRKM